MNVVLLDEALEEVTGWEGVPPDVGERIEVGVNAIGGQSATYWRVMWRAARVTTTKAFPAPKPVVTMWLYCKRVQLYVCGVCSREFDSEDQIRRHIGEPDPDMDGDTHDGGPWRIVGGLANAER